MKSLILVQQFSILLRSVFHCLPLVGCGLSY